MSLSVYIFGIFVLSFSRVNADVGRCTFIGEASSATASSGENMVHAVNLNEGWEPATSSEKNPYIQVGFIWWADACNALEILPDQTFHYGFVYPTKKLRFFRVAVSDDGTDWTFVRQHPKDRPHELGFGGLQFNMAYTQPFFVIFPWSSGKHLRIYPIRTNPEYGRFRFQVMQCYAFPRQSPWSCPAGKHKWIDDQSCLPDALCGSGWSGNGGYCYKLFTSSKSYETAQSACEVENADLLSVHSTEERNYINTIIISTAVDDVWIGLKDAEQVYFQWSDTSDNDYIFYDTTKMYDAGEFCVKINRLNSYKWEDTPCSSELPYICKQSSDCRRRLVGPVTNTTLTASVDSVPGHEPEQAKIVLSGPTNAGWRPLHNDHVYIQTDLGSMHRVVGVLVKSSHYYDPVLWFTLHYSHDGNHFLPYMDGFVPRVFQGSRNDSMRTEMLPTVVSARSVQIHPKRWVGDVYTIWIELFGCPGTVSDPVPDGCVEHKCNGTCESIPGGARCLCLSGFRLGEDHHSCIQNGICSNYERAGISDGFIENSQISSNSEQSEDRAINMRIGGLKAWCTLVSSAKRRHFLTVDLKTVERVIGVELANIGNNSHSISVQRYPYLKSYKLAFSFDGEGYQYIRTTDKFYHIDFEFTGFTEEARPDDRKIQLFRVTKARYIRLYPVLDPDSYACVRMEILLAPPINCTKPDISMCTRLDHGCSHRCVTTNSGYVCQCPDNYHLLADRKSCAKDARCGRFPEISFQGRCYAVNMNAQRHWGAIKDCQLFGGNLIDIQTLDELYFITHRATFYESFHIGQWADTETDVKGIPVEAFKWHDEENLGMWSAHVPLFISSGSMVLVHASTWKPGLCKKYCEQYLISGRWGIDHCTMSASSETAGYEAYKARFSVVPPVVGWTPMNTTDAYLQVNFGTRMRLSGIITEPGDDGGVVTVYQMSCVYHEHGTAFVLYREQTSTRAFLRSSERITVIKMLEFPIDVFAIRIHPIAWTDTYYRLKVEVLGCAATALASSTSRVVDHRSSYVENRRVYDSDLASSFFIRKFRECITWHWGLEATLWLKDAGLNETFYLLRHLHMHQGFRICNRGYSQISLSFEIFVENVEEGGKGVDLMSPCKYPGTCDTDCTDATARVGYECSCAAGFHLGSNRHSCLSDNVAECKAYERLGLENPKINEFFLSASSELPGYEASKVRLNGTGAWCSYVSDKLPWIQIKLLELKDIIGVIIQTGASKADHVDVQKFLVGVTKHNLIWHFFSENNSVVFPGPSPPDDHVTLTFHPVSALLVRIYILPQRDTKSHCLRAEILLPTSQACRDHLNKDECADGNHNCSHLCNDTDTGPGYFCSCPDNLHLLPDGSTCIPDDDCLPDEGKFAGYCYHLHVEPETFTDAMINCMALGGVLLTIHSIEEYEYVIKNFGSLPNQWLGMSKFGSWVDQTPMTLFYPHSLVQTKPFGCTMFNLKISSKWMYEECTQTLPYICKIRNAQRVTTPPPPTPTPTLPVCLCHQKLTYAGLCLDRNSTVPTTLSCRRNCVPKLTSSLSITLQIKVTCPDCDWTPLWKYSWTPMERPGCKMKFETTCGETNRECRFTPVDLSPRSSCLFKVSAVDSYCPYFKGQADLNMTINAQPTIGKCEVLPTEGTALSDAFSMSCSGYYDEDEPVDFYFYATHDNPLDRELLHYGSEPNMPGMLLSPGLRESGYFVTLTVTAVDILGASSSKSLDVKVLPVGMTVNGSSDSPPDLLNKLETLVSGENTTYSAGSLAAMLTSGNTEGAVALIATVAATLNSLPAPEESTKPNQVQLRHRLITSIRNLPMRDNLANIKSRAAAVRKATSSTQEIAPETQLFAAEEISSLSHRMTSVIKNSQYTDEKEIPLAAEELLKGLTNVLGASLYILERVTHMNSTELEADSTLAAITGGNITADDAKNKTKKISGTLDSIVNDLVETVTEVQVVGQEGMSINTQGMVLYIEKNTPLGLSGKEINVSTTDDTSGYKVKLSVPSKNDLTCELPKEVDGGDIDLNLHVFWMEQNPHAWHESSKYVSTSMIGMVLKDQQGKELGLKKLEDQIRIQFNVTEKVEYDEIEMNLNITRDSVRFKDLILLEYQVPANHQYSVVFEPEELNIPYLLVQSSNALRNQKDFWKWSPKKLPSQDLRLEIYKTTMKPVYRIFDNESSPDVVTLYFALLPDVTHPYYDILIAEKKKKNEPLIARWRVEALVANCYYWDKIELSWSTKGCQVVHRETHREKLVCECDHLTEFSGNLFTATNKLFGWIEIVTITKVPIVLCFLGLTWAGYFILMMWARRRDMDDSQKGDVKFLDDNTPGASHAYLVTVLTGWRFQAGTSANVAIILTGEEHKSDTHWLCDHRRVCFQAGAQDTFLLLTDFLSICVQASTVRPVLTCPISPRLRWYLKQVIVTDLQDKEVYIFNSDDWLIPQEGAHSARRRITVSNERTLTFCQRFMHRISANFCDKHLLSMIYKCRRNSLFTRCQRVTCLLCFILAISVASVLFHGQDQYYKGEDFSVNDVQLTMSHMLIGLMASGVAVPVFTTLVQLFCLVGLRARKKLEPSSSNSLPESRESLVSGQPQDVADGHEEDQGLQHDFTEQHSSIPQVQDVYSPSTSFFSLKVEHSSALLKRKALKGHLPWWSLYCGWVLCVCISLVSTFFIAIYGQGYGYRKSIEWAVSVLIALVQYIFINQPIEITLMAMVITLCSKQPVEVCEHLRITMQLDSDTELLDQIKANRYRSPEDVPHDHAVYQPPTNQDLRNVKKKLKKEQETRDLLQDIFIYIPFLLVLAVVVYSHLSPLSFRQYETTKQIFVDGDYGGKKNFLKVKNAQDVWEYLETTFFAVAYVSQYYNGQKVEQLKITADYASVFIGTPRIRQIRALIDPCVSYVEKEVIACKPAFSFPKYDKGSYDIGWTKLQPDVVLRKSSGWLYRSSSKLKVGPMLGKHAWYPGGGYSVDLSINKNIAAHSLQGLKTNGWIDRKTRAVFVEFSLYNPPAELICAIVLMFEFLDIGNVVPSYQILTYRLYQYTSVMDKITAGCQVAFLIFILIFIIKEFHRATRDGKEYFRSIWSWLQMIIIFLSFCYSAVFIYHWYKSKEALEDKKRGSGHTFISFYASALAHYILMDILGCLVFVTFIYLTKLLKLNDRTLLFIHILQHASVVIFGVSFLLIIIIAMMAAIVVFIVCPNFERLSNSLLTITHIISIELMKPDIGELAMKNPTIGPLFYILMLIFVYFVLVPLFLMALNRCMRIMSTVDAHMRRDYEVTRYVWQKVKDVTGWKHRKNE